jgi:P27 family predicted phage terminase small subunit
MSASVPNKNPERRLYLKQPPSHLNQRAKRLWRKISEAYQLGPDHKELLLRLTEAVTRLDSVRETVDSDGLVVRDRFGQDRAHPLAQIEVQTRTQIARLLDQLGLDEDARDGRQVHSSASALARKRWVR